MMRLTPDLGQDQIGSLLSVIKSLQARRWGRGWDLMQLYSMVVLLEQHLEQRRRKMPHAQLRGIMRWISPPTAPACRGEIIPVKSSADHRPVTDAGRSCVEQFRTAHFPFPIPILHWNSKHLERGAFVRATEWRQCIRRCRTARGNTEGR